MIRATRFKVKDSKDGEASTNNEIVAVAQEAPINWTITQGML